MDNLSVYFWSKESGAIELPKVAEYRANHFQEVIRGELIDGTIFEKDIFRYAEPHVAFDGRIALPMPGTLGLLWTLRDGRFEDTIPVIVRAANSIPKTLDFASNGQFVVKSEPARRSTRPGP